MTVAMPCPEAHFSRRTATFSARSQSPTTEVVTAVGELDAANSHEFAEFALRNSAAVKVLILDLSEVQFFGTAGFSALHTINVQCAGNKLDWALVPGAAVTRILQICDPDSTLPTRVSVDSASAEMGGEPDRLLHLVAEPH